jgi:hypothetical protein
LKLRRKKAEYAKKKKEEKRKEEKEKKRKKKREKKRSHDDDNDDKKKKRKEEKREVKSTTQEGKKEHDVSPSIDSDSNSVEEDEKKETSREYKNLFENWIPLPLQMVQTDFENEEWLARKHDSNGETKTTDPTKHVSNTTSIADIKQGIQPLAHYLPHAEIYALPYVLPF